MTLRGASCAIEIQKGWIPRKHKQGTVSHWRLDARE
nr:MAG TPA: hypothetical protein [Caudoviricetes sp.]